MNKTRAPRSESEHLAIPPYYIASNSEKNLHELHAMKWNNTFLVLSKNGNIEGYHSPEGLFYHDTRHLSLYKLSIENTSPIVLSSVLKDNNDRLNIHMTTTDLFQDQDSAQIGKEKIFIKRSMFVYDATLHELISFENYDRQPHTLRINLKFDADFRDVFELRGEKRTVHGTRTVSLLGSHTVEFMYLGLDSIKRYTRLHFSEELTALSSSNADLTVHLDPNSKSSLIIRLECFRSRSEKEPDQHIENMPEMRRFFSAYYKKLKDTKRITRNMATIQSSNKDFNGLLTRSTSDLYVLATETSAGLYPYAGIPWFSTIFGRDGIITALMLLWIDPQFAKGVLHLLAEEQAKAADPQTAATPGKILHESRSGEMSLCGELPFKHYYGSVDTTILYIILAEKYYLATLDYELIQHIWPTLQRCLKWMNQYGDVDQDGFIEYNTNDVSGLRNQGWKDSGDSIFHADGTLANGPIALCEVQAYAYAAKRAGSSLARLMNQNALANRLDAEACKLQHEFDRAFWQDSLGTYAIALDGKKRPCCVASSNAGQTLFTMIPLEHRVPSVVNNLMSIESYSGWGIRTIPTSAPRYNPMSYHNGSVWPHDNALIALGLSTYNYKKEANRVFTGIYQSTMYHTLKRLPELFCGFPKSKQHGPINYPVACSPQAWASASPFCFLEASLGLTIDPGNKRLLFNNPQLPEFTEHLVLRNLKLLDQRVTLQVSNTTTGTTITVIDKPKDVEVLITK